MRILDHVANDSNANHGVNDGVESTGRDVGLMIPFEELHEAATIDGNPLLKLCRHFGNLGLAAHRFLLSSVRDCGGGGKGGDGCVRGLLDRVYAEWVLWEAAQVVTRGFLCRVLEQKRGKCSANQNEASQSFIAYSKCGTGSNLKLATVELVRNVVLVSQTSVSSASM